MAIFAKNLSTMEQQDKLQGKIEQFRKVLQLSSDEVIISSLEGVREDGEEYMILPIIELLFSPRDTNMKQKIVSFLSDLKSQKFSQLIIDSINNFRTHEDLHHLVSVCWQSRLNFTEHIDLFVDLLCNADIQTSIEAFSTIENMLEKMGAEKRSKYAKSLKSKHKKAQADNAKLVEQLIMAFEEFEEDPNYTD